MPDLPNPKVRTAPAPPELPRPPRTGLDYVELDVATNFSFLRGASHPDELVYRAYELGHRAIGITDLNSLAGVVRAHDAAKQANLKLLVGARLRFIDAPDLLVWASDRASYGRLCRLLTLGRRRAEKGECELMLNDFLEHQEGLVAAVDFGNSDEGKGKSRGFSPLRRSIASSLRRSLSLLRDTLTTRLSLATSCLFDGRDHFRMRHLMELGQTFDIPLVATNNVHYHEPDRRRLQDVLTCILHGCTIQEAGFRLFPNGERYLKSPQQMYRIFAHHPQALARTMEIAEQCHFSLGELRYEYPDEIVPAGQTSIQYLTQLAWDGAAARYPQGIPEKVRGLIQRELALIEQMKFEAYFLTVHDVVKFARSRNILCQGRGSAANSAVCYCIGVTSVDPTKVDLLFERFISAARNEPPDIDIDFEHERREEVIQYIYEKYGRERAGMTATVITYRGRSAVRDVGKALGLSLDTVDQLAKRLDWWHRGAVNDGELRDVGIDPADGTVKRLVELTAQILGFPRHLSQHTGGMVMTRGPLCEMVPIENASMDDRTVIEWDKDDIDALGILKVDVLALGMLTCLAKGLKLVNERLLAADLGPPSSRSATPSPLTLSLSSGHREEGECAPLELHTIPDDDRAVYDMICDADTVGVFQIESRAQMSMLPRLRPRNFYDLVIEVAIVRPGPIQGNMVHPYLRRRDGIEPVSYPSEALRSVLENTLGVPLFQEQAMKVVMVAAGFSGEEADRLRRAMAAWRKSGIINSFHEKIVNGMLGNGYMREFAEQTFEQIRGFSEYGFPESHAASFALLVYASCWLKRHYPAVFATALLNSQPMGFYAPAQIVRDARDHGVEVRPVDVNESEWDCLMEEATERRSDAATKGEDKTTWGVGGPAMRLGFRMLKGIKSSLAEQLVRARQRHGKFQTIAEFHQVTRLPVSTIRILAEADAFGSMGLSRRKAVWQVLELRDDETPLFDSSPSSLRRFVAPSLPLMPLAQEVMTDYATTSLSLKEHPVALVREELNKRKIVTAAELQDMPAGRWVKVAGLVLIRQRPGTASGIVFETLEDETGIVNLIVRPDVFDRYRAAARHAYLAQADGYVERQGKVVHVMVKRMHDLSDSLEGYIFRSRDFH